MSGAIRYQEEPARGEQRVFDYLREKGPSTVLEIASGIGMSDHTVRMYVQWLQDSGAIEANRASRIAQKVWSISGEASKRKGDEG